MLKGLQARDTEAFKTVLAGCGPFLIDYCTDRFDSRNRGEEVVFHLFLQWCMADFADATCRLSDWMVAQVVAACDRIQAPLN